MHFLIGLSLLIVGYADPPVARFGVALDTKAFPQATAKEALASVLKAVEEKRFDYLASQLADPVFIDDQVKRLFSGKFDEQVESLRTRFDPTTVKRLQAFIKEGVWKEEKDQATFRLNDQPDTVVRLKRIDNRWYLQNASKP